MKFQIDKQKLSDDQLLFLANFEIYFKQYVEKVLASYPDLGVIPCWNIMERKEQFFILESNADFGIKDSLYVNSKIESYIKSKLFVDFPECSLLLNIKYRMIPQEKENKKANSEPRNENNDDGLPTFLPQTPRYSFEQINGWYLVKDIRNGQLIKTLFCLTGYFIFFFLVYWRIAISHFPNIYKIQVLLHLSLRGALYLRYMV